MLVPTTGNVIVHGTDPSFTIKFDALPENSAVFAISHSIIGISIVHESVASLAGRHVLTTFSSCHESKFLLTMTQTIIYSILQ